MPATHTSAPPLILHAKLTPPSPGAILARPRLDDRLGSGLTLVRAEAGCGKSTLLADFVHRQALPAAWLRLDGRDRDPSCFFARLLAALRQPLPALGAQAEARLAHGAPPVEVAEALADDLAGALVENLLLVLDDFQEVDPSPEVCAAVTALVEGAPPGLRVCLVSRSAPSLPLPRWRARGQLTTLTAADLQFTPDEIAELYSRAYGLPLNPTEVEHLRVWPEPGSASGWRGYVRHVQSGDSAYFADARKLLYFMATHGPARFEGEEVKRGEDANRSTTSEAKRADSA